MKFGEGAGVADALWPNHERLMWYIRMLWPQVKSDVKALLVPMFHDHLSVDVKGVEKLSQMKCNEVWVDMRCRGLPLAVVRFATQDTEESFKLCPTSSDQ